MSAITPDEPPPQQPAQTPEGAPGSGVVIEWHRPDANRPLLRAWLVGVTLMMIGVGLSALSYFPDRFTWWTRAAALLGGLGLILGGLLHAVRTSIRSLADETYLLLRSDGLIYNAPPAAAVFLSWERLDAARVEPDSGALQLGCDDGLSPPLIIDRRFIDIDNAALAERINATQRRALMGILPGRSGRPR